MSRCVHFLAVTAVGVALVVSPAAIRADLFELANGGRIEGQLLNPTQAPRTSYLVRTNSGGQVSLSQDQVARHVLETPEQRRYQELLQRMPDSAEGHWKMAQWCGSAKLEDQYQFHLRQVLKYEPDHEAARQALGYHRTNEGWVNPEEVMEQRGMVRFQGAWRLPQEVRLLKEEEEQKEQKVQWRIKIKMWRNWIVRGWDKAAEGERNIRGIRDPLAAAPLIELLDEEKEPRPLKWMYVDVLARLSHPDATQALIRHALADPEESVRDRCQDRLKQQGSEPAVNAFIAALQSKDNSMINRAAIALGRMGDARATLPLIEALTTKHTVVLPGPGGSLGVSFNNAGGGGLTTGGGPRAVERDVQNDDVRHALIALHPSVNFGFDQNAWRRWYVQEHTPPMLDLRRGP